MQLNAWKTVGLKVMAGYEPLSERAQLASNESLDFIRLTHPQYLFASERADSKDPGLLAGLLESVGSGIQLSRFCDDRGPSSALN